MMQIGDGLRDDWTWSRSFSFAGFGFACFIAAWLSLFGSDGEQTTRRADSWLTLAGAMALYYMGRAGADGISRRQSMVSIETTRMKTTAANTDTSRTDDLNSAAG